MDQSVVAKDGRQHSMVSYQDMTVQSGIEHHQPIQPTFPYSHFAVMYIDNRGEVQVEASPSITGYEQVIFPEEVQERFLKLASGEWQPDSQSVNPGMGLSNASWYHSSQSRASELIPYEWQSFQNSKRHRRNPRRVDSGVSHGWEPPSPSPSLKRSTLRVGQTKILRKYYEMAFECFQQLNCRVIAKAFVKLVEPRKQVNHPYNGRRTVAGSIQELNPELTKPKWWPSGVTHKEPDHLGKPERVRLLVHILCELRESHRITAERLKEAGQDVRRQITPGVRLQVLDEIYYVRGMEELYLDGKISGDTTIHVSHVHLEEELQEQMMKNSVGDSLVAMPAMRREQLPVPRSHQAIPTISKDTYHLPLRNSKRPVNSESYLPMSPSSSPSVSRKSSLERSMPTYAPEIDPAILSGPEPPRSPADPRGLQSADATSIPEFFANQFAAEPTGHNCHPAFWDAMPAVHPQFAFTSY
ncbi:DUF2841 domain-containing protein [Aspergillus lucknowensis]|uniref:Subtelomeric hrmA-associated cluster protein AFUB-079030/YDR124W-like helical bundle domain-containing protein n=1 Tax=Aspergillus lucknowensis TaxID=176173 RepID=A0ABR4L8D2_9EURO